MTTGTLDTALLWFFCAAALSGAALMLILRHPMRVALALVGVMLSLAGAYAIVGVHAVAVFQVLIYVGAVMVFMVYVIMLLDVRDPSFVRRYTRLLVPGAIAAVLFFAAFAAALGTLSGAGEAVGASRGFEIRAFSAAFLAEHWLEFELTSVLLVAAVVAVLAVIKGSPSSHG
jgi:NADH-quinone oxidoreductase subunit J